MADVMDTLGGSRPEPGAAGPEPAVLVPDPAALVRSLEASGRFRRDTSLGAMLHRGKASFREVSPVDSLHVTIQGNRVSAHVDRICPLSFGERASARQYSLARVVAHNVVGLLGDLGRRLRRIGTVHRCQLECEVVWVDEEAVGDLVADLEADRRSPTAAGDPDRRPGTGHPGTGPAPLTTLWPTSGGVECDRSLDGACDDRGDCAVPDRRRGR